MFLPCCRPLRLCLRSGTAMSFSFVRSYSSRNPRRFSFDQNKTVDRRLAPGVGGILLLIAPLTTLALGVWQTKRRTWKVNLIAELESKTGAEIAPLPQDPNEANELEYRRVYVKGRFDHDKEMYIGPKSAITANEQGSLFGSTGKVGYFVVTPIELSDRGDQRILVNRGWVSKERLNPRTRSEGQVEGEVQFVGIVRKNEQREQFTPKNQVGSNRWPIRDIVGLSQRLDTDPIFVDADASSTVKGGPLGGQTRVTLRNDHFSYMLTWYSLSAATLFMWLKKFAIVR